MFKYDKFWKMTKELGLNRYRLKVDYRIHPTILSRLKNNMPVSLETLNKICNTFHCQIEDIVEHVEDDNKFY